MQARGCDAVARFDASAWDSAAQPRTKVEFREPLIPPKMARQIQRVLLYAAVVVIAIWSLLPFYVMLNASLSTTARYTQVATTTIAAAQSPLDRLTLEVVPPA